MNPPTQRVEPRVLLHSYPYITVIGVVANPSEEAVVREFFELFKTPWEFCQPGRSYSVVLCADGSNPSRYETNLVLVYGGKTLAADAALGIAALASGKGQLLEHGQFHIPIYGTNLAFEAAQGSAGTDRRGGPVWKSTVDRRTVIRIGYDLFAEVRTLLTQGQPVANAAIPTLELHIALLRSLIVGNGVALVEIPPVPEGYRLIACLTHDIDHPLLRRHMFDHTMFGFLYRATLGSLMNAVRGKLGWSEARRNWAAALKLPRVYLGLAKDPWAEFDRYTELEAGAPSSFFVIPFAGRAGRKRDSAAPSARAAGYGAVDIKPQLESVISAGCEVGLHGIDAWMDAAAGREEMAEVRRVTGQQEIGVRMHWLYFDEQSPAALEQAGASYDSTVGYNETIGFRAGTSQVYQPLESSRLLELPLHVMDTALFYPAYLNLSAEEAKARTGSLLDSVVHHGGCVTVNWHDRSIAAERLWGEAYTDLVKTLRAKGAWFATASECVAWFRERRAVRFEVQLDGTVRASLQMPAAGTTLPPMMMRTHTDIFRPAKDGVLHATAESKAAKAVDALEASRA